MPSIRIAGPYEVYFTSHDQGEPHHVPVDRDKTAAKIWLNLGFSRHELLKIERLVEDNVEQCMRKWNEHFGT